MEPIQYTTMPICGCLDVLININTKDIELLLTGAENADAMLALPRLCVVRPTLGRRGILVRFNWTRQISYRSIYVW